MENVITYLKALSSGIGKQDVDTTLSFYSIAQRELETEAEQEAFRFGALAMFADVGKMRLRRVYYTHKFKKALKQLRK